MTGMPNAEVDYADVDLGSRILELLRIPQRRGAPADRVPAGATGVGAHRPAG